MNRRATNLLKLAIGLGLLYWLYTKLEDPARLWAQIRAANGVLLLAALACYTLAVATSALKWGVLLRAIGISVGPRRLLTYQWMAEFFNNFLPAQVGGDVMRGYALASDTRRTADAAASVLIDRFLGLLVFMVAAACASLGMLLWGRPDGSRFIGQELTAMRVMALGSVAISAALLAVIASLLSRRLKDGIEMLLAHGPLAGRLLPVWHKLAMAFNAYRHKYRALAAATLGSVAIVFLTSVQVWLIAEAIEPGGISLMEVLVVNPIIVLLLVAVPLSPGGLGVRQGAFSVTFFLIGAGGDLGYAVGLMQQFIVYLVSLPGGLIWMRSGVRRSAVDTPAVGNQPR